GSVDFADIIETKSILLVTCQAQAPAEERRQVAELKKLALQRTARAQSVGLENRIRRRVCLSFHAVGAGDQPGPWAIRIGIAEPKPPIPGAEVIAGIGDIEISQAQPQCLQAVIAASEIRVHPS